MKIRLYSEFTEKQLSKELDTDVSKLKVKEISVGGFFGDYIQYKGYKFKKVYSKYMCMATPKEEHTNPTINIIKAKTDSLNYKQ